MQKIEKGRKIMKNKKHFLFIAVVAGILCVSAPGQIELPFSEYEPLLIGQANPALAGIDNLHVSLIHPEDEPNGLVWEKLKAQIDNKINNAGMKVFSPEPGVMYKLPIWPELVIRVDLLKLEQSKQYVFHIQTSLARMVYLKKQSQLSFKTDVWKTEAVMQAASIQNTPATVTNVVLKQTDIFIRDYLDAKQKGAGAAHANQVGTTRKESARSADTEEPTKSVYVASKNSKVFHKSGCTWVKRIKPDNLISYKTREDAVNDGKRPCKNCKP